MLFDMGIEVFKQGLSLSAIQQGLVAENISNISTPGYRRKDVDFRSGLTRLIGNTLDVNTTHMNHMPFNFNPDQMQAIIRRDNITAINSQGNNVDLDKEMVNMATNNAYFDALSTFTSRKFATWNSIISERVM
jgi:flagellar basal-body rod protein FlgB